MTDFAMFTPAGNSKVAEIATTARELAGLDGPVNPARQAMDWAYNELVALAEQPEFEEATDTAVREAVFDFMFNIPEEV